MTRKTSSAAAAKSSTKKPLAKKSTARAQIRGRVPKKVAAKKAVAKVGTAKQTRASKKIASKAPRASKVSAEKATSAGGSAGFRGYLYQVEVSVWAALDLVLVKGMAQAVELEPLSDEDIEALLRDASPSALEPTDPGPASVQTRIGERALVIQAKLTSTGDWSHAKIAQLLKHGGERRRSAKERLQEPNVEYVLVTSGPLTGVVRDLAVHDFTQRLDSSSMPASIAKQLPRGAAGRVKVIEAHDQDRITSHIKELLVEAVNVPIENRESCLTELRDVARLKMTGRKVRFWTREEIAEVVLQHGGYLATSAELTQYVQPGNWSQLCDRLDQAHAVIIHGRSGTGKTMTAAALWNRLHATGSGYRRVVADRPSVVREPDNGRPVVFDIEDPWGQYRFEPNQEQWLDRLPQLLRIANANRKFIITTREDVMMDANMRDSVKRWMVSLQSDDYSLRQKRRMFDDRVPSAPRNLQIPLADARERILGELTTPNEIDRLFANLRDPDLPGKRPVDKISAAVERARYDAIEATIARQVRARDELRWTVIVWALLGARRKLTREVFVDIQTLLAERNDAFATGLERFLNFFIAGRTLRQTGQLVSYYHPRAEAALTALAGEEKVLSAKLIAQLLDALTQVDVEGGWGSETAAFVLAFVVRSKTLAVNPNVATQTKIDSWICQELVSAEGEVFRETLRVAAAAGSSNCLQAEFARFVLETLPIQWFARGQERRHRPDPDIAWYAWMRENESVRALCRKWVETTLPYASEHYVSGLVPRLAKIEPNIASSFIAAMDVVIRRGGVGNADVIAAGAVVDLDAVEPVVVNALDELDGPSDWPETSRKIRDGVYPEGYAQHLSESAGENAYSAHQLIEEYVAALRKQRGWQAIAQHAQVKRLGWAWAGLLLAARDGQQGATPEELKCLLELGSDSEFEYRAWNAATQAWAPALLPLLLRRVSEPIDDATTRESMAVCIARGDFPMADIARDMVHRDQVLKLLVLFEDLKRSWRSEKERPLLAAVLSSWASSLPTSINDLARPFFASTEAHYECVAPCLVELVAEMTPTTRVERQLKVRLLLESEKDLRPDIELLLEGADDNEEALFAMHAACLRELTDVIEQALMHPIGVARAEAFRYFAERASGVLTNRLLAFHADESRYVREVVVKTLARDPRSEYLPALEVLVADSWSDHDMHFSSPARYPIARVAATALARVAVLDNDTAKRFYGLASNTHDAKLRQLILQIMVSRGDAEIHDRMLALALRTESTMMARAVAQALLVSSDALDTNILQALDVEQLLRKEPGVAAQLIVLLGILGPETTIDRAVSRLATHRYRKVLLVLLARVCQGGFPAAAEQIRLQLPALEAVQKYLAEAQPWPSGAFDDLGDALTVEQVQDWLATIDASDDGMSNL